ncbi:MAG: ribosome assembly RNA-binding protein YhbY [Ruminococcaceae bacterium]|nr:ribosome assembly RNA-binding protein YhbY [Oscillospiraceae bacterium]
MLTSKQRAFLRSKATAFEPILQVGKGGVSENMLILVEKALDARELIKVHVLENCEYTAREAADGIAEAVGADVVQVIGRKFVLFRISPENRTYDLLNFTVLEKEKEKKRDTKTTEPKSSKRPAGKPAPAAKSRYTIEKKKK